MTAGLLSCPEPAGWCYAIDSHTGPIELIIFKALIKNTSGLPWTSKKSGMKTGTMITGWGELWQFNGQEVDSFAGLPAGQRSWREIGRVPWSPYRAQNNKLVEYYVTCDFIHPDDVNRKNNSVQFFVTNKEIEEGAWSVNECRPLT